MASMPFADAIAADTLTVDILLQFAEKNEPVKAPKQVLGGGKDVFLKRLKAFVYEECQRGEWLKVAVACDCIRICCRELEHTDLLVEETFLNNVIHSASCGLNEHSDEPGKDEQSRAHFPRCKGNKYENAYETQQVALRCLTNLMYMNDRALSMFIGDASVDGMSKLYMILEEVSQSEIETKQTFAYYIVRLLYMIASQRPHLREMLLPIENLHDLIRIYMMSSQHLDSGETDDYLLLYIECSKLLHYLNIPESSSLDESTLKRDALQDLFMCMCDVLTGHVSADSSIKQVTMGKAYIAKRHALQICMQFTDKQLDEATGTAGQGGTGEASWGEVLSQKGCLSHIVDYLAICFCEQKEGGGVISVDDDDDIIVNFSPALAILTNAAAASMHGRTILKHEICNENRIIKQWCDRLPVDSKEGSKCLEKDALGPAEPPDPHSLLHELLPFMTCRELSLKRLAGELMYEVCGRDVDMFTRVVGVGNGAGLLQGRGLFESLQK
jgi:hypothetical protein